MNRWLILSLLLLVAPMGTETRASDRHPAAEIQEVRIRLLEYRFDPAQVTIHRGRETELILVNDGAVMHEFVTDALKGLEVDVEINGVIAETFGLAELEIPPKAKVVLRFTPDKPGDFPIACHAEEPKDHLKEGMAGKLAIR